MTAVNHRWVQHPNLVELADGTCWAGVMPIDGTTAVQAVWDSEEVAIRIWKQMREKPRSVCDNLGVRLEDAVTVDVGRVVRQSAAGQGWRNDRVVCEQSRVLDRREPGDPGWAARVAGMVSHVGEGPR